MPRAKNLSHYPVAYQQMIRDVGIKGETLRVPLATRMEGLSLRGQWHSFAGALKEEVRRLKSEEMVRPLTPGEKDMMELLVIYPRVAMTVEEHGGQVYGIWQNRENSWQVKALARAERIAAPASPAIDNSVAARLMNLQKEVDNGNTDR